MLFNIRNVLFYIHYSKELLIRIKFDDDNHSVIKIFYKDKLYLRRVILDCTYL